MEVYFTYCKETSWFSVMGPLGRPIRQNSPSRNRSCLCRRSPRRLAPLRGTGTRPEHVHTYRITPLAVWNARAAGHDAEQLVDVLERYSRFPVPHPLLIDVVETMSRYGRVKLHKHPAHGLILNLRNPPSLPKSIGTKIAMLGATIDDTSVSYTLRTRMPETRTTGKVKACRRPRRIR